MRLCASASFIFSKYAMIVCRRAAASLRQHEESLEYRLKRGVAAAKMLQSAEGPRKPDAAFSGMGFSYSMPVSVRLLVARVSNSSACITSCFE